jgi:hypothetical protein
MITRMPLRDYLPTQRLVSAHLVSPPIRGPLPPSLLRLVSTERLKVELGQEKKAHH